TPSCFGPSCVGLSFWIPSCFGLSLVGTPSCFGPSCVGLSFWVPSWTASFLPEEVFSTIEASAHSLLFCLNCSGLSCFCLLICSLTGCSPLPSSGLPVAASRMRRLTSFVLIFFLVPRVSSSVLTS